MWFLDVIVTLQVVGLCHASGVASSQPVYNTWTRAQVGEWISVAAAGDNGQIVWSIDNGGGARVFRSINNGLVNNLTLSADGANAVTTNATGSFAFVGASDKYYRTFDGGLTWNTTLATNKDFKWVSCDSTGDYVFVGIEESGGTHLALSTKQGEFKTVGTDIQPLCVAISGSAQYLGAGADNGLFISSDYGVTFTNTLQQYIISLCTSYSGQFWAGIASDGLDGVSVYISSNFGATWSQPTVGATDLTSVSMSGSGQLVLLTYAGGVYLSTTSGTTWSEVFTETSSSMSHSALDYSGIYQYAASVGGDLYYNIDTGASQLPSVLPTISPTALPTVHPSLHPFALPTLSPSFTPSVLPTSQPSSSPTVHGSDANVVNPNSDSDGSSSSSLSSGGIAGVAIGGAVVLVALLMCAYGYCYRVWCFRGRGGGGNRSASTDRRSDAAEMNKNIIHNEEL